MRRTGSRLAATLLAIGASAAAEAEDGKLDVSLEVRARVETIAGQFRPAPVATNDTALLLRTLLAAEYDAGPIRVGAEILDGRVYFERRRSSVSTTEVNTLEPIQAYIATDVSDDAKAIAGRFTLSLGSRRVISRNAFRNTINSFTGAQAILGQPATIRTHLFWMVAQTRLPDDSESLRNNAFALDRERGGPRVFGAFVQHDADDVGLDATIVRLAENDRADIATRDRHLWTADARIVRAPAAGRVDFEIEGAWQWGRTRATSAATDRLDRRVSAGFTHAAIGRSFAGASKPRVSIAADYASGDGRGRAYTRYDPLYSSRGADFGPSSFYGPVTRANVVSVEARLETKPDARTDTLLTLRPYWLASATDQFATTGVRDLEGSAGRYAGTQIEGRVRHTLIPDRLRATAGAALLIKGRFLRDAANAPDTGDTRYGYLELTASF